MAYSTLYFYEFQQEKNASRACESINLLLGDGVVSYDVYDLSLKIFIFIYLEVLEKATSIWE